MNTRVRLLAMFATGVALFTLTWYFFGHERPQQAIEQQPQQKTRQELLIGTWRTVERQPPSPSETTHTIEFSPNGKLIWRETSVHRAPLRPKAGVYRLKGDTIEIDLEEGEYDPPCLVEFKIESLTENRLVTVAHGEITVRAIWVRQ
jgi:hypothetical protein